MFESGFFFGIFLRRNIIKWLLKQVQTGNWPNTYNNPQMQYYLMNQNEDIDLHLLIGKDVYNILLCGISR